MIIYRYELPDGGGPFCMCDGQNRVYPDIKFNDNTISGCDTIPHLKEWFALRNIDLPIDVKIKAYEGDMVHWNCKTNEIIIKKDTARVLNEIIND